MLTCKEVSGHTLVDGSEKHSKHSNEFASSESARRTRPSIKLFTEVPTKTSHDSNASYSDKQKQQLAFQASLSPLRRNCYSLLQSHTFERAMSVCVSCNFIVVILETDAVANNEKIPVWVEALSWSLLTTFMLEIMLALYTLRGRFHHDKWNIFDTIIIGTDFVMSVISVFNDDLMNISQLRILRLTRIARAAKLIQAFPELRLMLAGLAGAVNAIFWGTLLLILTVIIWSVIAVQFIQPYNKEVFQNGLDREIGCERCIRAYETTFQATLTFWTQIVAGDSWGRETVPIIEKYPWTALYFAGVYLSVGLALLNLILGVVVNIATEERERIQTLMIEEKKMDRLGAHDELLEMCEKLFGDGIAELHIDDMKTMYATNDTFRRVMDRMDICEEDLDVVWTILDSDKSGTLSKTEFATQIYKLKDSDTQFLLGYVRFYLSGIKDILVDGQQRVKEELRAGQDLVHARLTEDLKVTSLAENLNVKSLFLDSRDEVGVEVTLSEKTNGQGISAEKISKAATFAQISKANYARRSAPELLAPSGSLQILYEQSQTLRVEIEAAVQSSCSRLYPDRLADLHNIAWQSLNSIEDVSHQHKVIANILASQARCLLSMVKSLHLDAMPLVHTNGECLDHQTQQAI